MGAFASWLPPWPDPLPPSQKAAPLAAHVRYEDLAQDGRFILPTLAHSVGLVVWERLVEPLAGAKHLLAAGVVPILTRLTIAGEDVPLSVRKPVEFDGCYDLAHALDPDGEPRLFLNVWTRAHGPIGRTHGPQPANAGERALMGSLFAEHTFTRLFAPAGARRVTRLDAPGLPLVPPRLHDYAPPADLLALPGEAEWLEPGPSADEVTQAIGLIHTDANQHVNSLVTPRWFEEAALRRFARLGLSTKVLARRLDVTFRKPLFAGDRARVVVRAFRDGDVLGAVAAILPAWPAEAELPNLHKAHAFGRLAFW